MAKAKKRNPQDATLRNVRAARNSIALLQVAIEALEKRQQELADEIADVRGLALSRAPGSSEGDY